MIPVANALRTIEMALSGTPTAVPVPPGISVYELRCTGSADWAFQTLEDDEAYPVAADVEESIPLVIRSDEPVVPLLVSGSGTLSIAIYGDYVTDPATATRIGPVPRASVAPEISGDPDVGATLTLDDEGTWSGDPDFTYQWQRAGQDIPGATDDTYILTDEDVGLSITCVVTGTNDVGTGTATSNAIVVGYAAPENTVAPVVSGTATAGSLLTTTNGTWTGSPTITYTYQWQADGVDIVGETADAYTTVVGDVGKDVGCVVTATNPGGSDSADSNVITVTA